MMCSRFPIKVGKTKELGICPVCVSVGGWVEGGSTKC